MKTILSYGIVSLLAVSLLAGTGYILLNPTEAQAERDSIGSQGQTQGQGRGGGGQGSAETGNDVTAYGQGRGNENSRTETGNNVTAYGQGRGNESSRAETAAQTAYGRDEAMDEAMQSRGAGGGAFGGAGASDGRGQSSGAGQGRNETVRNIEWETMTGTVIVIDGEVTIQTAEGEVLIGMGQSAYWADLKLAIGDEITVIGFHEDGEFKAGTVENLDTGETIVLRDEAGRPMWSGRGQLKNQG